MREEKKKIRKADEGISLFSAKGSFFCTMPGVRGHDTTRVGRLEKKGDKE